MLIINNLIESLSESRSHVERSSSRIRSSIGLSIKFRRYEDIK
jgi:hypothetical protein